MDASRDSAPTSAAATHVRWPRLRLGPNGFIRLVVVAGAVSVATPSTWTAKVDDWLAAFVALLVISTILEFVSVDLPLGGDLSMATISHVAAILLLPAPYAALCVGLSILVEEAVHRRALVKIAFNTATYVFTVSVTSFAVGLTGSPPEAVLAHDHLRMLGALVVAAIGYYAVTTLIVSVVTALATGRSVAFMLRASTRNTFLVESGAGTIGGLLALIWTIEPIWTITLTVPGAVISQALRYIRQLEDETSHAVKTLARVIDHRDATTYHHSERVALYARALAEELRLDESLTELICQAAEVHDLGKIGVPDRVLLKPGPLTESERTVMWLHTEIGARILHNFRLFRPGTNIVLHHHERYDGAGYPHGLQGEQIPLGARVVAVADAFDAMTQDRPYRRALPAGEAIERLREGAGTQWDPVIVGAFLRIAIEGRLPEGQLDGVPAADHITAGLDEAEVSVGAIAGTEATSTVPATSAAPATPDETGSGTRRRRDRTRPTLAADVDAA